jgi:methanogenic corrinoid protein MtbC1
VDAAPSEELNLKQAAALLGVHYMTAYRYVRTGRLPARRAAAGWVLDPSDLVAFAASGDEPAAWRVIEQALAAGHTPAACYLDLVVGAIDQLSSRATEPEGPIAQEYLAVATATRLVARLGARFRRPGRGRGTVVFGAALGEHHLLPISIVADLVRLEGFNCLELGADVPPRAFAGAAAGAHRLVAVGIGVTWATNLAAVRHTVEALRALDPTIPVVLGGQAAANDPSILRQSGADAAVVDGREAVQLFNQLARSRRKLWLIDEEDDVAVNRFPAPAGNDR